MPWQHPTAQDHDHRHDERKNDFPPIDRLETKIPTAVEIAHLVKSVDIMAGAGLIEQYAGLKASEAAAEAIERTGNRIIAQIEAPLGRKVSA